MTNFIQINIDRHAKARVKRATRGFLSAAALTLAGGIVLAAAPASAGFKADWAKLIAAAQKEGKVSIAAGGAPSRQYRHVFNKFYEKFGITVEVSRGGAGRTTSRVLAERKAKKYTTDIALISVRINNQRLVPTNALIPFDPLIIHPEVLDKSKWVGSKHYYGDKFLKYTFFYTAAVIDKNNMWYNTKKISAAEIATIKSQWDFLKPKWKGKIEGNAMEDPSGIRQMIDAWQSEDRGPDWVRKYLTGGNVTFSADRRILETWLVKGRYPIRAVSGAEEDLRTLAEKGLPIKQLRLPRKVGILRASGSGCCISAFAKAPHPNAAKLFANWFLSKEGQTAIHTTIPNLSRASLRTDIPWGNVEPDQRRTPGQVFAYPDADPKSGDRNKKIQDKVRKIWGARKR